MNEIKAKVSVDTEELEDASNLIDEVSERLNSVVPNITIRNNQNVYVSIFNYNETEKTVVRCERRMKALVNKDELYAEIASRFEDDANIDADYVINEVLEPVFKNAKTVDAVPVSFIEKQINSAEWMLTHIGNSDYYGNESEEYALKCYLLRSLINKWRDE